MGYQYEVSCHAVHVEEVTLPPNSTLHATLEDVSQEPCKVVARSIVNNVQFLGLPVQARGLGFGFRLAQSQYTRDHEYVINARIVTAGELRFISKKPVSVDPAYQHFRAIDVELILAD